MHHGLCIVKNPSWGASCPSPKPQHISMFSLAVRANSGASSFSVLSSIHTEMHAHIQIQTHSPRDCCAPRVSVHLKCCVTCAHFLWRCFCSSVSRVSLAVLPSPALFLLSFLSPQLVENSPCIIAHIPTSFILHRPLSSSSLPLLSLSLSAWVFRSRPSISQGSILSLFPNRISILCCQIGFSEVPITASCLKNLSLVSDYNAHCLSLEVYLKNRTYNFLTIQSVFLLVGHYYKFWSF